MSTGVVLLAAGSGRRFGGRRLKQFLLLNKRPLFHHPLSVFRRLSSIKEIILVVPPSQVKVFQRKYLSGRRPAVTVVAGGKFRGESVRNGLRAFRRLPDVILVHDSARPLVEPAVVKRVEAAALKFGAALAAWPLPDTLKEESNGWVRRTIPRKSLWLAQTPQGFRRDVALRCLSKPDPNATDDVELAQRKGIRVKIVNGSPRTMKVTYPVDLKIAQRLVTL